jgi:hypothetical protein
MTAPDRIWAYRSSAGGLRSQDWTADEDIGPRFGTEYLRRSPEVLAADESVKALVAAARAEKGVG